MYGPYPQISQNLRGGQSLTLEVKLESVTNPTPSGDSRGGAGAEVNQTRAEVNQTRAFPVFPQLQVAQSKERPGYFTCQRVATQSCTDTNHHLPHLAAGQEAAPSAGTPSDTELSFAELSCHILQSKIITPPRKSQHSPPARSRMRPPLRDVPLLFQGNECTGQRLKLKLLKQII